jgi:phosphohistidine phosphatase SixA
LAAVLMRLLSTLLILACLASAAAAQDAAAAWAALRAGGHVALIRHAGTVGGSGDPPEFRLEDCATQRNLTLKGRAEARRLGELFRSGGVSVGKVLSSQWCRCLDTVALMGLGTPELAPTFNNAFTFRDRVEELTAGARAIVADWSGPGTLVAVTHGANILPLTGIMPEEGGVVVVKADLASASKLRVLGKIPVPVISGQ